MFLLKKDFLKKLFNYMNILILGDIMGPSGREAIIKKLPDLIKKKKLDFVIVNGENAADPGVGITKKNTEEFFEVGVVPLRNGRDMRCHA